MATLFKSIKLADGVTLNDAQSSYSCSAQDMRRIAPGSSPTYWLVGSGSASAGSVGGVVYGGMSATAVADSAQRSTVATPFVGVGDASVVVKLKDNFDNPGNASVTPFQQLVLTRASGAGSSITVNVWAFWTEDAEAIIE